MIDDPVGPIDTVTALQKEALVLEKIIRKMLADIDSGVDPQLIRYLQEFRQVQSALFAITSGRTTVEKIRETIIIDNLQGQITQLKSIEKQKIYSDLKELEQLATKREEEQLALPEQTGA